MKENRKVRDSVFVDLFSKPENFLSLYNALSGQKLKLEETNIKPESLSDSVYKSIKNDVSMLVNGKLIVLLEHQSTINKNMPLRCLMYVGRLYEQIVPVKLRFKVEMCKLPTPEFYVLYNGLDPCPEKSELHLSDAFMSSTDCLELNVQVLNIHSDKNLQIQKNCDILRQYSLFVDKLIELRANEANLEIAFKKLISWCNKNDILAEYLKKAAVEVQSMYFVEYNYEDDIAAHEEEAAHKANVKAAKAMLKMNLGSVEQVAQAQGLPLEEVKEIFEHLYDPEPVYLHPVEKFRTERS